MARAIERLGEMVSQSKIQSLTLRSRAQVSKLFEGVELMGPGVVPVDQWRPDEPTSSPPGGSRTFIYGAVGRKP